MSKPYLYPYIDKGYSRRHETRLYNPDGSKAPSFLITRYTYEMFTKPCEGPRGGKARMQCARNIFYRRGVFYKACNVEVAPKQWKNSYKPFEGWMWDVHAKTSRRQGVPVLSIETVEGVPVTVKDEAENTIWEYGDSIAELEDLLAIPEQDRAGAEATTTPELHILTDETGQTSLDLFAA